MKVYPLSGNIAYLERSRRGGDTTEKDQGNAGYSSPEQQEPKKEEPAPSYSEVESAVSAYTDDPSLQALGLEAEVENRGPGLRVTLKGGQGAFVRQFTGQEFLEMREAARSTGRGKLLDKKL